MAHDEMPILTGLRHVVETALEGAWDGASVRANAQEENLERSAILWSGGAALLRDGSVVKILHS
jgi:hypothetical protein